MLSFVSLRRQVNSKSTFSRDTSNTRFRSWEISLRTSIRIRMIWRDLPRGLSTVLSFRWISPWKRDVLIHGFREVRFSPRISTWCSLAWSYRSLLLSSRGNYKRHLKCSSAIGQKTLPIENERRTLANPSVLAVACASAREDSAVTILRRIRSPMA